MPLVIITVREELFPETHCWTLQDCMAEALRAAGWLAEPWVQKVVRLPPAELSYHSGSHPEALAAGVPNFVLVEVLLHGSRPTTEKEAFWAAFSAGVQRRLPSKEPDVLLGFVELPSENFYYNRQVPPL